MVHSFNVSYGFNAIQIGLLSHPTIFCNIFKNSPLAFALCVIVQLFNSHHVPCFGVSVSIYLSLLSSVYWSTTCRDSCLKKGMKVTKRGKQLSEFPSFLKENSEKAMTTKKIVWSWMEGAHHYMRMRKSLSNTVVASERKIAKRNEKRKQGQRTTYCRTSNTNEAT